jgi:Holliday junction resolvase
MHENEAYAILDEILSNYGASEFGRICQILLGFSFLGLGYEVKIMQLSGRPDIIAIKSGIVFDVEVKTSTTSNIVLKSEDLTGVNGHNSESIIAVLTFPDMPLRWLMINAKTLRSGNYSKTALATRSAYDLEESFTIQFLKQLEEKRPYLLKGASVLRQLFRQVQE